jgi:hypothetical protein
MWPRIQGDDSCAACGIHGRDLLRSMPMTCPPLVASIVFRNEFGRINLFVFLCIFYSTFVWTILLLLYYYLTLY